MANEFPHPFGDLAAKYRELRRKLPHQISVLAAGNFKENFRRQGYLENGTVQAWKKRAVTEKGRKRALLVKSGRLKRGIRPASDYNYAKVINSVPYAAVHNEGMVINARAKVDSFTRNTKYGSHQVKAHTKQINTTIPARPFMITTPDLMEEIEEHFFNEIDKIWKP